MAKQNHFKNLHIVNHPLVRHKLTLLRDVNTPTKIFKESLNEITILLTYEATKNLPLTTEKISTPLETIDASKADQNKILIVPILRAGLGMVEGLLSLMPWAKVGHIGLYRDEKTLKPHHYYYKIPKQTMTHCFVCDPMLATGGSAVEAITELKQSGIQNIIFICVIASPEGVQRLSKAHPDVLIYAANLDQQLNKDGYIVPGLGDAGDRLFGTK